MKKLAAGLLVFLGAGILAAGGAILAIGGPEFARRLLTYPFEKEITAENWYRPRLVIPGRPSGALPWPDLAESFFQKKWKDDSDREAKANRSLVELVWHKGKVIYRYEGIDGARHMRPNAMSMTKSVISLLIGQAIEKGEIASVDDPVARYLPRWVNPGSLANVRDLLQMSSGLRNWNDLNNPFSDLVRMHLTTRSDDVALQVPQEYPPGQKNSYNNTNYQLLGLLLRNAAGANSIGKLVQDRLWGPLGASEAFFWGDESEAGQIQPRTYCCFFATGLDWLRVGVMLLQQGKWNDKQIVPARYLKKAFRPSKTLGSYGMGFWIDPPEPGDERRLRERGEAWSASGAIYLSGRGLQRVVVIPDWDMVIVRLGEKSKWQLTRLALRVHRELQLMDRESSL